VAVHGGGSSADYDFEIISQTIEEGCIPFGRLITLAAATKGVKKITLEGAETVTRGTYERG
jgi:hypothetical protein